MKASGFCFFQKDITTLQHLWWAPHSEPYASFCSECFLKSVGRFELWIFDAHRAKHQIKFAFGCSFNLNSLFWRLHRVFKQKFAQWFFYDELNSWQNTLMSFKYTNTVCKEEKLFHIRKLVTKLNNNKKKNVHGNKFQNWSNHSLRSSATHFLINNCNCSALMWRVYGVMKSLLFEVTIKC